MLTLQTNIFFSEPVTNRTFVKQAPGYKETNLLPVSSKYTSLLSMYVKLSWTVKTSDKQKNRNLDDISMQIPQSTVVQSFGGPLLCPSKQTDAKRIQSKQNFMSN